MGAILWKITPHLMVVRAKQGYCNARGVVARGHSADGRDAVRLHGFSAENRDDRREIGSRLMFASTTE